MLKTLDLDCLRSLVLGVELGSFARAAARRNRSSSAVSAQLRKLEELLGREIAARDGRGLTLTPTGERLYAYAKRLLDINDEALTALQSAPLHGLVRLGLSEDFGSSFISNILAQFVRTHPEISVEIEVSRNAALLERIGSGRLDLALAWDSGETTAHSLSVATLRLHWIGPQGWQRQPASDPVPLVSLEAPCVLRNTAITALEQADIRWRQSYSSAGLGEIWAAVAAGLGITVRPAIDLPTGLQILDGLPALPTLGLSLHRAAARPSKAVQALAKLLVDKIHGRGLTL